METAKCFNSSVPIDFKGFIISSVYRNQYFVAGTLIYAPGLFSYHRSMKSILCTQAHALPSDENKSRSSKMLYLHTPLTAN